MGTHSATIIERVVTVLVLSVALWVALFSIAQAESIPSFDARIDVLGDSSMVITETISYDFGNQNRHGIYRNIYNSHPQEATSWYKDRYTNITLLSVLRNGRPEPYNEQPFAGLSVRIGNPNRTITGVHTYEIRYRVDGALAEYRDGVELYWNVTGDEWSVPMNQVKVEVYAIEGAALQPAQACYVGYIGSNQSCSTAGLGVFIQNGLSQGQQVTIAQRLSVPGPIVTYEKLNSTLLVLLFSVLWFIGLTIWIYRWRTQHRINKSVVAQYEPYKDFKPMFTGVLLDNKLDPRDISAGIVYLAQQGFISIKQTTDKAFFLFETTDYEITLLRSGSELQPKKKISPSKPFGVDSYRNRTLAEAEINFHRDLLELFFGNTDFTVNEQEGQRTVRLSEVKKKRARTNAAAIYALKADVVTALKGGGFLQQRLRRTVLSGLPIFAWFIFIYFFSFFKELMGTTSAVILFFVSTISLALVIIFASERRTRKGYEALNHLKGFKGFLETTDKDRYKFHNAPSKSPEQFMEYLPYAIAFGVEKEWAEVFKDVALTAPEWYSTNGQSDFSPYIFTSDLGSFTTDFLNAKPGGSSSGFGGSGGGGFSGGGGGGGGGGSW